MCVLYKITEETSISPPTVQTSPSHFSATRALSLHPPLAFSPNRNGHTPPVYVHTPPHHPTRSIRSRNAQSRVGPAQISYGPARSALVGVGQWQEPGDTGGSLQ